MNSIYGLVSLKVEFVENYSLSYMIYKVQCDGFLARDSMISIYRKASLSMKLCSFEVK